MTSPFVSPSRVLRHAALLALALVSGFVSEPAVAVDAAPGRPFTVTRGLLAGRLRVMGKPGDLALRNRSVTAIVRKSDGWLVDFWPNKPTRPTAAQLDGITAIDGLWLLHPVLLKGRSPVGLTASAVRAAGDRIETLSTVGLGAGSVDVITTYRLDGDKPRLVVTTRVKHSGGGRIRALGVGDVAKWGNLDYFVQGVGRAPPTFVGLGHWVGRKGASGDLLLRSLEDAPMHIRYRTRHPGLAPAIHTTYARADVDSGDALVVRRVLAYAPISDKPPPPAPSGTLQIELRDENDKPLAAKLDIRGRGQTPTPDFGDDGDQAGAGHFVWSGNGHFARPLPIGDYSVMATAGIERDAARWNVHIHDGATTKLEGRLPRVIKTPGWISGDLHLHQAPSIDADIACTTRVIAVAAEGVELAVATDHYTVTDLAPTVARLHRSGALSVPLMTMVGTELSTVGNRFGHFNVFPLHTGDHFDFVDTTPHQLFSAARAASPHGLLQVNHPRWSGIGYFWRYRMDPKTARIPARYKKVYDPHFDAVEVFNGVDAAELARVRRVLHDWLHLLGRGYRYTATGNSDSHKLFFDDPGLPRNLIHYGTANSDADDTNADPAAVIAALHHGHVVVTNGPVIDVDVNGVGPGGTVHGHGARVPLHIRVRAAPWIDVRQVEVLLGARGRRVRFIPVPASKQVLRLDRIVHLAVPAQSFVVVLASGRRDLPNVYSPGVKPFAFTNPIWLAP